VTGVQTCALPIFPIDAKWKYDLVIWDYRNDTSWVVKNGKSIYGEAADIPEMWGYNPSTKTGFLTTYLWEGQEISQYKAGKQKRTHGILGHYEYALARLSLDSVLVASLDEERSNIRYYLYSFRTEGKTELSLQQILRYGDLMLTQFGMNIQLLSERPTDGVDFWHTDWTPDRRAFVCRSYNHEKQQYETWFKEIATGKRETLHWDVSRVLPIWK